MFCVKMIYFYPFRKLKSSHLSSSNKTKYIGENKTIMSPTSMNEDTAINRKIDRDDTFQDKILRKAQQQKQSSHPTNSSSRGKS